MKMLPYVSCCNTDKKFQTGCFGISKEGRNTPENAFIWEKIILNMYET
jgi:hypothetical protein